MINHPEINSQQSREDIAVAVRAMSALGYIHAFGHVSTRVSEGILITPTSPPPRWQQSSCLLKVDFEGNLLEGEQSALPIEVFLHLGIYRARPEVNAICRTHSTNASIWGRTGKQPPLHHGFGGFIQDVALFHEFDLVHTMALGAAAAEAMGSADALLLKGNGALTTGSSVAEAAAKTWALEERCTYALALQEGADELEINERHMRKRWYAAEMARVWSWLKSLDHHSAT